MKLTKTDSFADAVKLASDIKGYNIFEGYESEEKAKADFYKKNQIENFYVSPDGRVLFIFKHNGERILNEVKLSAMISSSPLSVIRIEDDGEVWVLHKNAIDKSDTKTRQEFSKRANEFYGNHVWAFASDIDLGAAYVAGQLNN